uniref:Putative ovule protein n=1 Tax=Solanum chacoense TaxID=4108 RepID=A0A0V0GQA7_SOLCH
MLPVTCYLWEVEQVSCGISRGACKFVHAPRLFVKKRLDGGLDLTHVGREYQFHWRLTQDNLFS